MAEAAPSVMPNVKGLSYFFRASLRTSEYDFLMARPATDHDLVSSCW
jgi:hypothetical protein